MYKCRVVIKHDTARVHKTLWRHRKEGYKECLWFLGVWGLPYPGDVGISFTMAQQSLVG